MLLQNKLKFINNLKGGKFNEKRILGIVLAFLPQVVFADTITGITYLDASGKQGSSSRKSRAGNERLNREIKRRTRAIVRSLMVKVPLIQKKINFVKILFNNNYL